VRTLIDARKRAGDDHLGTAVLHKRGRRGSLVVLSLADFLDRFEDLVWRTGAEMRASDDTGSPGAIRGADWRQAARDAVNGNGHAAEARTWLRSRQCADLLDALDVDRGRAVKWVLSQDPLDQLQLPGFFFEEV
jgi:hypothetical protein